MSEIVTRRTALGIGLAAIGTAAASRDAIAKPTAAKSRVRKIAPLPPDARNLRGLSDRLIATHHAKNYSGAVKQLNGIRAKLEGADPKKAASYWSEYGTLKAGEAAARNSAVLHELYFANLSPKKNPMPKPLRAALKARFGGWERLVEHMRGCAKSTSGWVLLALDHDTNALEIVPTSGHAGGAWHMTPLLVLDVFEHSYAIDYGPDKGAYLDAFFDNVAWMEVGRRYEKARA